MSLTITEKEHWKTRIEKRIDAEIERLKREDKELFDQICAEARDEALEEMGITRQYGEIQLLHEEISALQDKHESLQKQVARTLRDDGFTSGFYYNPGAEIEAGLQKLTPEKEEALMKKHPEGRRVLNLEREKESLLDTVWLSTSPPQIRTLWREVDSVLGVESSELQNKLFG